MISADHHPERHPAIADGIDSMDRAVKITRLREERTEPTFPRRSVITAGLRVAAEIAGESIAEAIQLGIEYDPDPPFASGHPDRASAAVKTMVSPTV